MTINSLFFIFFSINIVISAIMSIVSRNIINSLLFSIIVFFMIGGLFWILGASYNAVVQLMIYVVIIPIFIAVAIMMTKHKTENKILINNKPIMFSLVGLILLSIILGCYILLNQHFFAIIKTCTTYVNSFSDLISISRNIFGIHPILLLELGFAVICLSIGFCHYEK